MPDTSFSKPSHTNGPIIKIYDLSGTGGPYAEAASMLGWDPVGLQWVKVKVDSSGQVYIANPGGGGSGGGGVQYAELSTVGVAGTGNLILGHDLAGIARVPTVGSMTNAQALAVQVVDAAGSQIVNFGTSTTTVVQGTAANLNATVVGTVTVLSGTASNFLVTTTPTGTQTVKSDGGNFVVTQPTAANLNATVVGTVTNVPSGTQNVSIVAGTAAVTQATSPWVVSQGTASNLNATVVGTVTNVPSGTQSVAQVTSPWIVGGTTTVVPSGTQPVSGTVTIIGTATLTGTDTSIIADSSGKSLTLNNDTSLQNTLPVNDRDLINRIDALVQVFSDFVQPQDNFTRALGQVGPRSMADGQLNVHRLDKTAALITADGHARYQEAVLRGNVFIGANAAGVTGVLSGTAMVGLIVYNPPASGKNLALLEVNLLPTGTIAFTTASFVNLGLRYVNNPVLSGTTTDVLINANIGSPVASVAKVFSTATAQVAPTLFYNTYGLQYVSGGTAGAGASLAVYQAKTPIDGIMVIPPGVLVALGPFNAAGMVAGIIWEEVTI